MIKESIKVKNVGALKNVRLEELKPMTVLTQECETGRAEAHDGAHRCQRKRQEHTDEAHHTDALYL